MQLISGLHFNNIRGDIYGGLTAAVVALPLAMAMGVASGVGPIAGMYGAIFVGFFAALFGGTPSQVSGPTGPMSFSSAKAMVRRHASTAGYQIMLLDLTEVPSIDFTTARTLEDIIMDTINAGRHIFLVGARPEVCQVLKDQQVLRHIDAGNLYLQRLDALHHTSNILNEAA